MKLMEQIKCATSNRLRSEDDKAEWIEKIANEHAIEFANWISFNCVLVDMIYYIKKDDKIYTMTELLKMYKSQRGL